MATKCFWYMSGCHPSQMSYCTEWLRGQNTGACSQNLLSVEQLREKENQDYFLSREPVASVSSCRQWMCHFYDSRFNSGLLVTVTLVLMGVNCTVYCWMFNQTLICLLHCNSANGFLCTILVIGTMLKTHECGFNGLDWQTGSLHTVPCWKWHFGIQ